MIWYVGPESKVYHSRFDCPALKNPWRYHPLRSVSGEDEARIKQTRRPCQRCHPHDP